MIKQNSLSDELGEADGPDSAQASLRRAGTALLAPGSRHVPTARTAIANECCCQGFPLALTL